MRLTIKLPFVIVCFAILASVATGLFTLSSFEKELKKSEHSQLLSLMEGRSAEIKRFFATIGAGLNLYARNPMVRESVQEFASAYATLRLADTSPTILKEFYGEGKADRKDALREERYIKYYDEVHEEFHPWYNSSMRGRGFDDVMIADPKGNVVYSALKKEDFATNLLEGPLKSRGIGKLYKRVYDNPTAQQWFLSDLTDYKPNSDLPVSFMAAPVFSRLGHWSGVLFVRMPVTRLNKILSVNKGMGETGETYLVGEDKLMRSQSRFSKEMTALTTRVDSSSVRLALEGKSGDHVTIDYRGIPVFSAYSLIEIDQLKWAILSEIDEEEVMSRVKATRSTVVLIIVIIGFILVLVGTFVAKQIVGPVVTVSNALNGLAGGDMNVRVPDQNRKDEIGQLINSFHIFYKNEKARKEMEDRLQFTQHAVDRSMDSIFWVNPKDASFEYANDAAYESLGYTKEEFFDLKVPDINLDFTLEHFQETVEQLRKVGTLNFESRERTKSGEVREVEVSAYITSYNAQEIIVASSRDITERKQAQRERARNEKLLSLAMSNMTDGMYMLDQNMCFTMFNEQYKKYLQLDDTLVGIGKAMKDVVRLHAERGDYGPGDVNQLVEGRMASLSNSDYISRELTLNDGASIMDLRKAPIQGGGAVITISDVTERKHAEERLKDAFAVISSSIEYASKIQRSILPDVDLLEAVSDDYFVLWEPRDVVGGDVYWMGPWGDGFLIVLGDCTGHGVPGAFMTLVSIGALERAKDETPAGKVAKLVSRMHQYMQSTLNQRYDGGESDDGIELGACYIEPGKPSMIFTGARFELFVVEGDEVETFKGVKRGLGYRSTPYDQEYSEIEVDISGNRKFYMTTDGLIDQVGGERRRMFGKRRFKRLLLTLQGKPLSLQRDLIAQALSDYQAEERRRDDVAAIGFSVKV